eukprot:s4367_g4.t1
MMPHFDLQSWDEDTECRRSCRGGGETGESSGMSVFMTAMTYVCKDKASGGHSDIELQSVVGFNAEGFHSDGVHDQADFDNDCLPVLTSMYCYQRGDDRTGETSFLRARTAVGKLSAEELSSLSKLA